MTAMHSKVERIRAAIPPDALQTASDLTGLSLPALLAIATIEGGSAGPDAVRFECHLFNRWSSIGSVPCTIAPGVSYSRVRAETDYQAFLAAFVIDPETAVRASSWGAFQVLSPCSRGVCRDAHSWLRMWKNIDRWDLSIRLLVGWLNRHTSAVRAALEACDAGGSSDAWAPFCKAYNGPGYAKHNYHGKLSEAYLAAVELESWPV